MVVGLSFLSLKRALASCAMFPLSDEFAFLGLLAAYLLVLETDSLTLTERQKVLCHKFKPIP